MNDSPTMITLEVDGEKTSIPVVYKKITTEKSSQKTVVKSSITWYQTMSLSTVVGHDDHMYKLRLPYAKDRIQKRIKIKIDENVSEAMVPGHFTKVRDKKGAYVYLERKADGRWQYRKRSQADGGGDYDYIPPRSHIWTRNISYPGILNYTIVRLAHGDQIKYDKESRTYEEDRNVKDMVREDIDPNAKNISLTFLNPNYKARKDNRKKAYNLVANKKIVTNQLTGNKINSHTKNIGLDCFAFELISDIYMVFIAGNWYITFSNPNKFFTEDYRLADKQDIAEKIKEMKKKLFVHEKDVDPLILEVYAEERMYNESRKVMVNETEQTYFSYKDILDIIKKKVKENRHTLLDTDASRAEIVKKIEKKMQLAFYKYVTLHPVWDTEERFEQCIKDMGLQGDPKKLVSDEDFWKIVYRHFDEVTGTDTSNSNAKEDAFGTIDDDENIRDYQLLTYEQLMEIAGLTRKEVMSIVDDDRLKNYKDQYPKDHVLSYLFDLLNRMNIVKEDDEKIVEKFTEKLKKNGRFSIKNLQKTMINIYKSSQGKYDLFKNLMEGTGNVPDNKDLQQKIDKEILDLKDQIKKATDELDNLANEIKKLVDERTGMGNVGDAGDQDYAADTVAPQMRALDGKINEKRIMLEKLSPGGRDNKTIPLKRQLHALGDTNWVLMKDSLEKAGVKAINKRAQKINIVMSIEEFMDMISKFSGNLDEKDLKEELEALQPDGNPDDIKNINSRLNILAEKYHNNDFKTMMSAAKYIYNNVSRNSNLETIRDLCSVCSYDNYKTFNENVDSDSDKSKSEWFTVENKEGEDIYLLRKVHDFLNAMAIVHFVTEYTDQNEMDMKTTTRTNGIPFALRYDLFKSGVHSSKLEENTFVKLKTAKDSAFLFPATRRKGLYDKTEEEFTPPGNPSEYKEFHKKASKILELPDAVFKYDEEIKAKKKKKTTRKSTRKTTRKSRKKGMESVMSDYNLERRNDTAADGNCFFDALKKTMDLEETKEEIRQAVVDKLQDILKQNPKDEIRYLLETPVTAASGVNKRRGSFTLLEEDDPNYDTKLQIYFASMRLDGSTPDGVTWADQAIVRAAVALYQRPIYIINNNTPPNSCVEIIRKNPEWDLPQYKLDNFIVLGNDRGVHFYGTKKLPGFENGQLMSLYFREKIKRRLSKGPTYRSPTKMQPPNSTTCAMYALNNLNIGTYEQADLEQIRGEKNWWGTRDVMIALGAGVELDESGVRKDTNDTHVAFEIAVSVKDRWKEHSEAFLNANGLMGMLFFFPPTIRGHWTALRVESSLGEKIFTYSDSLREGNDPEVSNPALTTSLNAVEMVKYLSENEETTYGGERWSTAIMVFQTESDRKNFAAQVKAWRKGKPKKKPKRETVDLSEEPSDKEELIREYMNIIKEQSGKPLSFDTLSDFLKKAFWQQIQKLFRKYARLARKEQPDKFKELPDFNKILSLENKKWVLRKFVVWKGNASKK